MLDDLKYIHSRDGQDALGIAEHQWEQLEYVFDLPEIGQGFRNIVYAGMGGSGLAGLISKTWPGYKLPFEIVRDYHIPSYVSPDTLFIASSYSGNTEETLSALAEAEKADAKIAIIADGGELEKIAKAKKYPLAVIPASSQPRYAVFYNLRALVTMLEKAGLVAEAEADKQLKLSAEFLQTEVKNWTAVVPTSQNPAKQLALELVGKSPVIYGGPLMAPAAYKWKIDFNENSKTIAWWNQLSEFNHNEFIGWSSHPFDKPYSVIELRSNLEHQRITKRFKLTDKLLSGRWPAPHIVEAKGKTLLEQLLWLINFGDFVSIYLALLNGVNPTPVDLVEKFKKELDK